MRKLLLLSLVLCSLAESAQSASTSTRLAHPGQDPCGLTAPAELH
jgi:hypothetical protein